MSELCLRCILSWHNSNKSAFDSRLVCSLLYLCIQFSLLHVSVLVICYLTNGRVACHWIRDWMLFAKLLYDFLSQLALLISRTLSMPTLSQTIFSSRKVTMDLRNISFVSAGFPLQFAVCAMLSLWSLGYLFSICLMCDI